MPATSLHVLFLGAVLGLTGIKQRRMGHFEAVTRQPAATIAGCGTRYVEEGAFEPCSDPGRWWIALQSSALGVERAPFPNVADERESTCGGSMRDNLQERCDLKRYKSVDSWQFRLGTLFADIFPLEIFLNVSGLRGRTDALVVLEQYR